MGSLLAIELVADHYLVPKHEIVPKEKQEEILVKYGIDTEKLPEINKEDPAVSEINARIGDIIKITRKSPTAGKAIFFRVVV